MYRKEYYNFVRPTSFAETESVLPKLSGEQAKKMYLEEIQITQDSQHITRDNANSEVIILKHKKNPEELELSNLKLFTAVQNNDIETLQHILDGSPDKINTVDKYGWSLLMIACQANSVEVVKELLRHGIDTAVRDKAGNTAHSLIIRNKNVDLANIMLSHGKAHLGTQNKIVMKPAKSKKTLIEKYFCEICNNKSFSNKQEHLSSTIHNINASKGMKIPTKYVIPESNKGYQIMLKVGWDKDNGLGPDGSGQKYPIRTVHKNDKKGLGHNQNKKLNSLNKESMKLPYKKYFESDYQRNRRIEINFRREFY